jgi:hypothetical protein
MGAKKSLLLFLISIAILSFLAVSASAGCCISNVGSTCLDASSSAYCSSASSYYDAPCYSKCSRGCCCYPNPDGSYTTGQISLNYSCYYKFVLNPSLAGIGTCSCVESSFTVSGTITNDVGGTIGGATVSASGVPTTTISSSTGAYTLTGVPGGTVQISASAGQQGCLPNARTITFLTSNQANFNIQLDCSCTVGLCNSSALARCVSPGIWQFYNSPVGEYCQYCSGQDTQNCVPTNCNGGNRECGEGCSLNENDANYDPDCVCDINTQNFACPRWCDWTDDADCPSNIVVNCGDHVVAYPFESCEDNPDNGQFSLCDANTCIDEGLTGQCNCAGTGAICGNGIIEGGEQCELQMRCNDGSECNFCQCGASTCNQAALVPQQPLALFNGPTRSIIINWTRNAACPPARYYVHKCTVGGGDTCNNKQLSSFSLLNDEGTYSLEITDSSVLQRATYKYYVEAVYIGGSVGETAIFEVNTGAFYCLEPHPPYFCWNNAKAHCDPVSYNIITEPCPSDQFCMQSAGQAICSKTGSCDLCNGLYGMFANNPDTFVYVDVGTAIRAYYCHPGSGRVTLTECYLDRTKTMFSAFNYCGDVESCYDYKSQTACEDINDPCGRNMGCEWAWINDGAEQLGGVCRPQNEELQQCELCDDSDYNWLSPRCTPDICSLFGTCYYIGAENDPSCTNAPNFKCPDYLTQQECVGAQSQAVAVDVVHDAMSERISGSNQLTQSSPDALGLRKCYWFAPNSWCLRNADNYPEDNQGSPELGFDCPLGDLRCEVDFGNPETIILPSGFSIYPASVKIRYAVSDNEYSADDIQTYFCAVPSTQTCYPHELDADGVYEKTFSVSGRYNIMYYSVDYAKNLEEVKTLQVNVDADPPDIQITSPTEANFPTNQNSVTILGTASPDTLYMCSYISGQSTKRCINNCAFNATATNCINSNTGEFSTLVNIPSNGAYGVLFDAEDFVGNKITGVSLLSIYRNDTRPRGAVIIIEEVT